MSLPFDAAEAGTGSSHPPSDLLLEAVTEVFSHLDGVIEHASTAQRRSRHVGDDRAFHALDDAISLLQHVRSRLHYDLAPQIEQETGPVG